MTEDLQHLLEKIQKDGIDQAEKTASEIIEKAKHNAKQIVEHATKEAQSILQKAAKDAESFADKGNKALEQAARNTIIATKAGILNAVESVIANETSAAMDENTMGQILLKIVDAYCSGAAPADILVNQNDVEKFKTFILNKLSDKAREGLQILPSDSVSKGFRLVIRDKNLEHDLTDTSIKEALSRVLRPHIAEIMDKA